MFLLRIITPTAPARAMCAATLAAVAAVATGCTHTPKPPRISHAPTYSYMHDTEALAEIERWPDVPSSDPVFIMTTRGQE